MKARVGLALALPPVAWYLFEVGLGSTLVGPCAAVGRWLGPLWGAGSLGACAAAVAIALPVARRTQTDSATPWLGRVAILGAGIFALAILYQALAVLIVPSCA